MPREKRKKTDSIHLNTKFNEKKERDKKERKKKEGCNET